jgi:hypothetical protein
MRPRTLAAALAAPVVLSGLALAGRAEGHAGDELANRKDKGYSGMRRYYTEAAWQARLAAGQACAEQREAERCRREVVYDELIVRGRLPHTTETGNPVIARDARGWPLSRTPDEREGSPCARRTDGSDTLGGLREGRRLLIPERNDRGEPPAQPVTAARPGSL